VVYRTRGLLIPQRTQTINALRAHLAKQGIVAPTDPAHIGHLAAVITGDDGGALPSTVRDLARLLLDQITTSSGKVADLDAELHRRASVDVTCAPSLLQLCAESLGLNL